MFELIFGAVIALLAFAAGVRFQRSTSRQNWELFNTVWPYACELAEAQVKKVEKQRANGHVEPETIGSKK